LEERVSIAGGGTNAVGVEVPIDLNGVVDTGRADIDGRIDFFYSYRNVEDRQQPGSFQKVRSQVERSEVPE